MAVRPVVRILAFGDSLTEGWCDFGTKFHPYTRKLQTLVESLSKSVDVVNQGVSGETTGQMCERLPLVLDKDGPFDLVIILAGTNDLGLSLNKDGEPLFQRLKSLHELALRHSPLSIAVTIPETGYETMDRFTALKEKRLLVNTLLKKYVQDCGSKIILSDLSTRLPRESLSHEDRRKFWADGLHFTPAGYDRMGEITAGVICRTPNAECRTPNAERRMPNAERRTPNAERRISVSGISCETCAFCKHGSHRDYRYLGQLSPVLPNCFALLRCSLLWSIVTVAIFSFSLSAMNRIQIMTFTQSDTKGKLFIFQNQKSL